MKQGNLKAYTMFVPRNNTKLKPTRIKPFKQPKKGIEEECKADNTLQTKSVSFESIRLYSKLFVYRRNAGIRYSTMEVLVYVYVQYCENGIGCTSWSLANALNSNKANIGGDMRRMHNMLTTLVKLGSVDKLGTSVNGANLYIPSQKTIKDFSELSL